ncbi:hypothetical protein [Mesomycoplasma lagogenitalium]|uniref:Uncharacterized protein n=1 Tax=Mesomycoplasma lagogenitalium TaxID=171286 RepID=A0ABY8LTX6_9BACT|nr:hypothetical protein [Mesomycoplasma lagogenitalium]WGI36689.1 hypothetical protein QEG99_00165 [Mesomycoplasma lagogenitalium]
MDIKFGKMKGENISSIDGNNQSSYKKIKLYESDARKLYGKWDNVKIISENDTTLNGKNKKPKTNIFNSLWGINIKTKERYNYKDGENLKFAIIITLKELNGQNRKEEFIKWCSERGWLVNEINIKNEIDIYNKSEEEINFE